jgi:hypothetical protein
VKPRATVCPVSPVDVRVSDPTVSVWEGFLNLWKLLASLLSYFLILLCI